jgi:hypothetical protein
VRPWYLFNKDKERVPDECFHSGNEKQWIEKYVLNF